MRRCGEPGESPGGRCLGTAPLFRTSGGGVACLELLTGPRLTSEGVSYTFALKAPSPASTRRHAGLEKRAERMR